MYMGTDGYTGALEQGTGSIMVVPLIKEGDDQDHGQRVEVI